MFAVSTIPTYRCTAKDIRLLTVGTIPTDRYTVKHLLQHDFFLEDSGLKVELVNREDEASNRPDIQMRLRVVDAKKRKDKHKENEAIQFDFNIHNDQAEEVAKELVNRGLWLTCPHPPFLKHRLVVNLPPPPLPQTQACG